MEEKTGTNSKNPCITSKKISYPPNKQFTSDNFRNLQSKRELRFKKEMELYQHNFKLELYQHKFKLEVKPAELVSASSQNNELVSAPAQNNVLLSGTLPRLGSSNNYIVSVPAQNNELVSAPIIQTFAISSQNSVS
ncbi:24960_t:CDS:1, partial [Gigaspora margarita]